MGNKQLTKVSESCSVLLFQISCPFVNCKLSIVHFIIYCSFSNLLIFLSNLTKYKIRPINIVSITAITT